MTEETMTVKSEVEEYKTNLNNTRHELKNFQSILPDNSMIRHDAELAVIAINGIMDKLETPNFCETVDLDTIVKISDDVRNVQTSAAKILAKKVDRHF